MEVVFDGDCLRAQCFGKGEAGLFVTFDFWRHKRAGFPDMRPVQRALEMGYRSLVIASADNDWFLNDETKELRRALTIFTPQRIPVRAFGFSMGGYGALMFSRPLRLRSVMLFGAQASIRSEVVPFETRWRREAEALPAALDRLAEMVRPGLQGVLLYDPRILRGETLQARAIQKIAPGVRAVAMPFSGHPPMAVIRAGRAYGDLIAQSIAGPVSAADIRALHRQHREATPEYLQGMQAYLRRRGAARADQPQG